MKQVLLFTRYSIMSSRSLILICNETIPEAHGLVIAQILSHRYPSQEEYEEVVHRAYAEKEASDIERVDISAILALL